MSQIMNFFLKYSDKHVLKWPLKNRQNKGLKDLESIAECFKGEHSAILLTCIKQLLVLSLLLIGRLRQVLLYIDCKTDFCCYLKSNLHHSGTAKKLYARLKFDF